MKLSNSGGEQAKERGETFTRPRSLKVAQITDTHLFEDPEGCLLGMNTRDSFQQVLGMLIDAGPLDLVLATGDLVHHGSPAGYQLFCSLVVRLECPVYCLPGNHDEGKVMAHHVNHPLVSMPRLVDIDEWRFVLLDSTIPGEEGGRLSPRELEHLEGALKDERRPTLVCLHHQPVPVGSTWIDSMAIDNPKELFGILDTHPQVKGVVWGHVHQELCLRRGAMQLMATPSTCVQFAPQSAEFRVDSSPPGCRLLELHPDGRLDSCVLRLRETPLGLQMASAGY